jgi:hypothetical protein
MWGCWNPKTRLKGAAIGGLAAAPLARLGAAAMAGIALTACGGGSGGGSLSTTSSTPPQRGSLLQTPPQLVATYSTANLLAQLATSDLGSRITSRFRDCR